jgi:hypothetical protein
VRRVAPGQRAYERTRPLDLAVPRDVDEQGVAFKVVNGVRVDHPVRQATVVTDMVDSYRLTGHPIYLVRARANAERLIFTAVRSGDALFFPYPYDFALHRDRAAMLRAPWFSAMAQGKALAAFVRLCEATGERKWRDAAEATFRSFLVEGPRKGKPWVVHVDGGRFLWFEEFPGGPHPDRTFNGHIVATLGLHDYWQLTDDPEALRLIRGGLATLRAYQGSWRTPGAISRYCMNHAVYSERYHLVHIAQLLDLHTITGNATWARLADRFLADYPDPAVSGIAVLSSGRHTGYRFDARGRVIDRRTISLPRQSTAHASSRRTIAGVEGTWLAIRDGVLAGYVVREIPERSYLRGIVYRIAWEPARTLVLGDGTWTAYRLTAGGAISGAVSAPVTGSAEVAVSARAIVRGQLHYLVADGPWAGAWMPARESGQVLR